MSGAAPGAGGRNNPWLDAVRAAAIALVVARHGERALSDAGHGGDGLLATIALNGWVGVDLFFVLSGYLIARHLVRAGLGTLGFSWGRYLILRALRIVPAYYAVLGLTAAGALPLFAVAPEALGWRVAYHLAFLQDYLPSNINVVFWSLGVEEKFYLAAPFLILALLRCRSARFQAFGLIGLFAAPSALRIALHSVQPGALDYATFWSAFRSPFHMSLEGFVVGVAIAVVQTRDALPITRRSGTVVLVLATTLLVAWLASHLFMARIDGFDVALQPPLIALACGGLVLGGVMLGTTPMPGAARRPAAFIAQLSYSLYLIHFPLIPLAMAVTGGSGGLTFWAGYLTISFAAALVLHGAVERPVLELKSRIAARPGRGSAAASPDALAGGLTST
jgi:peptidoglycan/LPS O-acetylase OafA/YrhL